MAVELTAKQLRIRLKKRLRGDLKIVREAAFDAVVRGEAIAVLRTDELGKVDRGLFKRSWKGRRIKGGGELSNNAPYAGVIEFGRRPGRPGPPLAPILGWVQRKFGDELKGEFKAAKGLALTFASVGNKAEQARRRGKVRRAFGTQKGAVDARVLHLAYVIRASIHRKGTKPHGILRTTFVKMKAHFRAEVRRRLAQQTAR